MSMKLCEAGVESADLVLHSNVFTLKPVQEPFYTFRKDNAVRKEKKKSLKQNVCRNNTKKWFWEDKF